MTGLVISASLCIFTISMQVGLSHDLRPRSGNAPGSGPCQRSGTYSLYTPAGIADARDSPGHGRVPRTVPFSTADHSAAPPCLMEYRKVASITGHAQSLLQVIRPGRVISARLCTFAGWCSSDCLMICGQPSAMPRAAVHRTDPARTVSAHRQASPMLRIPLSTAGVP